MTSSQSFEWLRRRNGQLHSAGIDSRTDSIPVRRPVMHVSPGRSRAAVSKLTATPDERTAGRPIATPPTRNSHTISRSSPQAAVDHNSAAAAGAVLAARQLSSGVVLAQFHPRRRSAYATG
jgi:hypothetical protein